MSSALCFGLFEIQALSERRRHRCVLQMLFLCICLSLHLFPAQTPVKSRVRTGSHLINPNWKKKWPLFFYQCFFLFFYFFPSVVMGRRTELLLPWLFLLCYPPVSPHLLSCGCSGGPVAGVGPVVGLQRDVQQRFPAAAAALQLLGARLG